jgi:hypothetical protein
VLPESKERLLIDTDVDISNNGGRPLVPLFIVPFGLKDIGVVSV